MQAGRELDALVAEKVMGWSWPGNGQCSCGGYCPNHGSFPYYSTDIAAAWRVVEKLRQTKDPYYTDNLGISIEQKDRLDDGKWVVIVESSIPSKGRGVMDIHAVSDSLPHAICLAALKAVGVEV